MAALGEQTYVEQARKLIEKEKVFLKNELNSLGYQVFDSQANYLFFRESLNFIRS